MLNVLFCLVVNDSISKSGLSEFEEGDFDSNSVFSTASKQNKEAQTSSNVSSLFVNNDGPLAKARKAASFYCELLLHNLLGHNIILTGHISLWSAQQLIPTEISFWIKFFDFSARPDPEYYFNERNDLDSDKEPQCVEFDLTHDERTLDSKRLISCPFIEYEAEETGNSYRSGDCDVAVCSLKKKQTLQKSIFLEQN